MKIIRTSIFTLLICAAGLQGRAQQDIDCKKVLDQQPYFVRHKSGEEDAMLKKDIEILKHCGNFDSIDSAFFKGPVLGALMLDQVRLGKPATYRTLIDMLTEFRKTASYKDFADGMLLYRKLKEKKVNPEEWEQDKALFVRMGFTVNDLDDFKSFMMQPENVELTYMAVLTRYMTEIEAMRVK